MSSFAQDNEKDLFSGSTAKYFVTPALVNKLFHVQKGQATSLPLSASMLIGLRINMNVWNDENTHTIGGSLLGYPEAFITITTYKDKDKWLYSGELISKKEKDAYRIFLQPDGNVCFERLPKDRVIVEN